VNFRNQDMRELDDSSDSEHEEINVNYDGGNDSEDEDVAERVFQGDGEKHVRALRVFIADPKFFGFCQHTARDVVRKILDRVEYDARKLVVKKVGHKAMLSTAPKEYEHFHASDAPLGGAQASADGVGSKSQGRGGYYEEVYIHFARRPTVDEQDEYDAEEAAMGPKKVRFLGFLRSRFDKKMHAPRHRSLADERGVRPTEGRHVPEADWCTGAHLEQEDDLLHDPQGG